MKIIKRTKTGWYQRLVGGWTPKRKQIDIGEFMSLVIPSLSPIQIKTASFSFHGSWDFDHKLPHETPKHVVQARFSGCRTLDSALGRRAWGPWHQKWEKSKIGFSPWICWDAFRLMTLEFGFPMISLLLCDAALFGGLNLHCVLSCGLRGSQMPTALTEWVNRPGDIHPPPSGWISTKFKKRFHYFPYIHHHLQGSAGHEVSNCWNRVKHTFLSTVSIHPLSWYLQFSWQIAPKSSYPILIPDCCCDLVPFPSWWFRSKIWTTAIDAIGCNWMVEYTTNCGKWHHFGWFC